MDDLKAQLHEEHLRPKGVHPMDQDYHRDRAEPAPRGPFSGYVAEPSRVSEAGPSNPFMHPQWDRPDDLDYETPQYDGASDHRVQTHNGMPPWGNRDPNAECRHCRGIDLRFFDDEGKFEPGAMEHFPPGEKLPKIKPIMGPLKGFAFSEAPTPSGSN